MTISQLDYSNPLCLVCGNDGNGVHFGVQTCRACAMFFRWVLENENDGKCTRMHADHFGAFWCILVHFDAFWFILEHVYPIFANFPVFSGAPQPKKYHSIAKSIQNSVISMWQSTD